MYCIVYFVPAKSVDYHPRYVTQRVLFWGFDTHGKIQNFNENLSNAKTKRLLYSKVPHNCNTLIWGIEPLKPLKIELCREIGAQNSIEPL